MKTNGPSSSLKYYTTFGQQRRARGGRRGRSRLWLWLALGIIALIGVAGLVILTVRTLRSDFETTRLPPFKQNLTLDFTGSRFQVGDKASIVVALGNPGRQTITIKRVQVGVPASFLNAFIVDDARATIDRGTDSIATVTYRNISVAPGGTASLAIPLQASRTGNYQSQIQVQLDVSVPVAATSWYMPLDEQGNYLLTLQRSITREIAVVLTK